MNSGASTIFGGAFAIVMNGAKNRSSIRAGTIHNVSLLPDGRQVADPATEPLWSRGLDIKLNMTMKARVVTST
jgi:hypothetical protein